MSRTPATGGTHRDLTWVVALAATLWGTSALLRDPLSHRYDAPTIVMFEHLVLVLLLLPWLASALRAFAGAPAKVQVAAVVIGGGSSALATALFTAAFALGDPVTPQVLQKLQPLVAMLLAALLLGERMRARFLLFAVPALVGAWLMSFSDPFQIAVADAQAAALAVGAAALWAAGTVLGRMVDQQIGPRNTLVLRFAFGLPAAGVIVLVTGSDLTLPLEAAPRVIGLALVPGLAALALYYVGLRHTAASRATLAELMFPVTAAVIGVVFLGATLTWSRWAGAVIVVASITALAWHEATARRRAVRVESAPT